MNLNLSYASVLLMLEMRLSHNTVKFSCHESKQLLIVTRGQPTVLS